MNTAPLDQIIAELRAGLDRPWELDGHSNLDSGLTWFKYHNDKATAIAHNIAAILNALSEATSRADEAEAEWRCFHCDEVFTDRHAARDHFGHDDTCEPACKIKMGAERSLLTALRRSERDAADAWAAIHSESTEAAKNYFGTQARHQTQLITAEELGYERGLADAIARAERAEAERDAAVGALTRAGDDFERLASSEAMTIPFYMKDNSEGVELKARLEFAAASFRRARSQEDAV